MFLLRFVPLPKSLLRPTKWATATLAVVLLEFTRDCPVPWRRTNKRPLGRGLETPRDCTMVVCLPLFC